MIRVLVVDDSALMRKVLGRALQNAGFAVETARDGLDALQRIGSFQPDVVTLDVEMPRMDGLACLDRIMVENPRPVVMVSALTEHGAEATLAALAIGAVDFIAKPEGTISLHIDSLAPDLIERVRNAAGVRLPGTLRLQERVRHRLNNPRGGGLDTRPPTPPRARPAAADRDSVVIVGCSTGGPPALDAVLSALPGTFGWPVLVCQHMPASFTGPLARRLDKLSSLSVVEVTGPTRIEPGIVYIGKGDADLVVGTRLGSLVALAVPSDSDYRWHPSVDRLVRSAMQHIPADRLVGVLLTGMGNDGAATMTDLRKAGGRTIAEAEETAVVWGMPGELVKRGGAEQVAPLPEIAGRLLELGNWK